MIRETFSRPTSSLLRIFSGIENGPQYKPISPVRDITRDIQEPN